MHDLAQWGSSLHEAFKALPWALAGLVLSIWGVLIFARGWFWSVRLPGSSPSPKIWPAVAAVIPARNEADVIDHTLSSVLVQDYPGPFTVFLVDDHSTDGTAVRARAAAEASGRSERLVVVAARPLPEGWTGKVWAQAEGLAAVDAAGSARYVWFTDADIWHAPASLQGLVARAAHEKRVLTSLMVRLHCESFAERALIPAFVFFFAKLYPFRLVNDPRRRTAAAAGGCMLAERDALAAVGGMAAIRDALIDDCALARVLKQVGPIRLDLGETSVSVRRYPDLRDIWNMIARSAFTQLRYSYWLLAGTVLGMGLTYLAPPALTIVSRGGVAWIGAACWGVMALAYLPTLRYYQRSPAWSAVLPLVALFYLGATLASAQRYFRGRGGQWKGRLQAPPRR